MSESFENSEQMNKVFANAGIEPDVVDENKGNETTAGTSTESGGTTTGTETAGKIEGASGKDSLGGDKDGGKKSGKEKEGKVAGNPGDLTLQDGSVVKAGPERRWYEQNQLSKQRLTTTQNELNTVNQKFQSLETKYNELSSTVSKIGMEDPADVSAAVTLYKDLTRDPKGTMTKLLAEMKVLGHTFEGVGGTVDTAAIQALLDRKLPASEEHKGPSKEDNEKAAATEVANFISEFPDAVTQEAHIAALMDHAASQGKHLSLRDAYFSLKERVINDGYDWTQPLGPQIEARKAAAAGGGTQNPKPRTNGRVPPGDGQQQIDQANVVQPERELDSDSIVRAAMKEAGYQVN